MVNVHLPASSHVLHLTSCFVKELWYFFLSYSECFSVLSEDFVIELQIMNSLLCKTA